MHTKGKWTVIEGTNEYIIEDREQPYASPVAIGMTKETANLIVQTHNSFEGLISALKSTRGMIKALSNYELLNIVEGALAQAEKPE